MSMYLCETCGQPFSRPTVRVCRENLDGENGWSVWREEFCPHCGSDQFVDAEPCPKCGNLKRLDAPLCRACMDTLINGFCEYADSLTAEEEAALDDLLDGESVANRRRWSYAEAL